jgi:hypothetical protein
LLRSAYEEYAIHRGIPEWRRYREALLASRPTSAERHHPSVAIGTRASEAPQHPGTGHAVATAAPLARPGRSITGPAAKLVANMNESADADGNLVRIAVRSEARWRELNNAYRRSRREGLFATLPGTVSLAAAAPSGMTTVFSEPVRPSGPGTGVHLGIAVRSGTGRGLGASHPRWRNLPVAGV